MGNHETVDILIIGSGMGGATCAGRRLLELDETRIVGVEALIDGERRKIVARIVGLSACAVNLAALLLASRDAGFANRSDAVGWRFMNDNASAVLAIDPRSANDFVYQKTLGINDFYLDEGCRGPPLGNIQLLGSVTAAILKSNLPTAPEWTLNLMITRSVDWYAMSEDLPNPRRAWDHSKLFVVDASFLPTSAGVNPSLTIAAQALRVADHISKTDL